MEQIETEIVKLNPIDYHRESNKITALFYGDKILCISSWSKTKVMYSFFIERKLIASDVMKTKKFFRQFGKYLKSAKKD